MLKKLFSIWLGLFIFLTAPIVSAGNVGVNFSYPLVTTDPSHLRGYQLMVSYDPQFAPWHQFSLYFDGGFSHFITDTEAHRSISIYSAAPVVRYTFKPWSAFTPYFELSLGAAYLSKTRFDDHNLGMHFAFQDRIGIGALVGRAQQLSIGLHALHYSNGSFCGNNAGISVPVMLDVGYRFD